MAHISDVVFLFVFMFVCCLACVCVSQWTINKKISKNVSQCVLYLDGYSCWVPDAVGDHYDMISGLNFRRQLAGIVNLYDQTLTVVECGCSRWKHLLLNCSCMDSCCIVKCIVDVGLSLTQVSAAGWWLCVETDVRSRWTASVEQEERCGKGRLQGTGKRQGYSIPVSANNSNNEDGNKGQSNLKKVTSRDLHFGGSGGGMGWPMVPLEKAVLVSYIGSPLWPLRYI